MMSSIEKRLHAAARLGFVAALGRST